LWICNDFTSALTWWSNVAGVRRISGRGPALLFSIVPQSGRIVLSHGGLSSSALAIPAAGAGAIRRRLSLRNERSSIGCRLSALPRARISGPGSAAYGTLQWPRVSCRISAVCGSRARSTGCGLRFPALSPVAWSTFATGVSRRNTIFFDFLNRSLKTYIPSLRRRRFVLRNGCCGLAGGVCRCRVRWWRCGARANRSGKFWGAFDREHDSAGADYVSAGGFQWSPAFRDVYAGSAWHAGQFYIFQHAG